MRIFSTYKHLIIPSNVEFHSNSVFWSVVAALWSYFGIIPLFFVDIYIRSFQKVYFGIHRIPKIDRSDYFAVDRYKLHKLTWTQKLNCVYCGYANGVSAFSGAVVAQMEKYSCAVKHEHQPEGQEHQKRFYSRKRFE